MVLQPVGEHFGTLIEHSSDAIALISAEGTVLYASPATTRILGYAIDEFVGRNALEFVHPDDQAYVVGLLSDLVQRDRAVFSGEFRYRHKDGSWRWIEGVGNNLLAEPGVGAIVANYRDVSERKQAEAVRAQLAAIVESSNDAIISKTLDGIITSWNPAAERLYGYPATEVVGRSICVIVPPDRMEEWQGIMGQIRRGECIHHFETVRLRHDGRPVDVSVTMSPVRDAAGQVCGASTIARDITGRVLAQQTLEQRVAERTRQLSTLYDVMAVASSSLDLQTMLELSLDRIVAAIDANEGFIRLLDERRQSLHMVVAQGVPPAVIALADPMPVASGLPGWVITHATAVVVPDITGDERTSAVGRAIGSRAYAGLPVRAKGQVIGVLSVLRDVDRPFNADEVALLASIGDQLGVSVENARLFQEAQGKAALEERQRLARDLHDSVTQSLYSLTLLAEAARRLVEAGDRERVAAYVGRLGETAQQSLKEMRLLVYELRPPALEAEGLVGALQQRLDAVEKRAGVQARLVVEDTLDLPAAVEEALYRIVQEALNNALKHAAATQVTVRLRAGGNQVEVEVMDNGRGFDPRTVPDRGGLGLISMSERAEKLGGSLTVMTGPGEGTTILVTFRLP